MVSVQEKLYLNRFRIDKNSHISIDKKRCAHCLRRPCLTCCPAGLFIQNKEDIMHNPEGCLECGTCYIVCEQDAIKWDFPSGGYGVSYRES